MLNKTITDFFTEHFSDYNKKYLLMKDFYNLTDEDKEEISNNTFNDMVSDINTTCPNLAPKWEETYKNIIIPNFINGLC